MAKITLDFPNALENRLFDAIAKRNNWDKDGPFNKQQFAKAWIIQQLKKELILHEAEIAERQAKKNVEKDIDDNLIIT